MDTNTQIRESIDGTIKQREALRSQLICKATHEYALWLFDVMVNVIQEMVIGRGESFFICPSLSQEYSRIPANCDQNKEHYEKYGDAIDTYRKEFGRWPPSVSDVAARNVVTKLESKYAGTGMKFYTRRWNHATYVFCDVQALEIRRICLDSLESSNSNLDFGMTMQPLDTCETNTTWTQLNKSERR